MTIGQFSKRVSLTPKRLRLYEKHHLLNPKKGDENGYRYYTPEMVPVAQQIRTFRRLGFSIREIQGLLEKDPHVNARQIVTTLENRLKAIRNQKRELTQNDVEISSIITSLKTGRKELNPRERTFIMNSIQTASVLICGHDQLEDVAESIRTFTRPSGVPVQVLKWKNGFRPSNDKAQIILVQEADLDQFELGDFTPQAVIIKDMSRATLQVREKYLKLFGNIGLATTTILCGDDRASIELARVPLVQKGRIYYFSKNKGLRDQIEKIGGVFSNGESIEIFGFHGQKQIVKYQIPEPLTHRQETALMIALTSLIDYDLNLPLQLPV